MVSAARLGELLEKIEPKRNKEGSTQGTSLHSLPIGIDKNLGYKGLPSTGGRKPDLPEGINHKFSLFFLFNNY